MYRDTHMIDINGTCTAYRNVCTTILMRYSVAILILRISSCSVTDDFTRTKQTDEVMILITSITIGS